MLSILFPLLMLSFGAQANDSDADEFRFIEEGEKNRALNEADRAPSASHFLEEENEEDDEQWSIPTEATESPASEVDEVDEVEFSPGSIDPIGSDPEEDMIGLGPDLVDREPLGGHFPISVTRSDLGALVAELPVLVARNQRDLSGDLWVVADIYTDGVKVTESRHLVSPMSVSDISPTYVWIKATIPVHAPSGQVEMRVYAAPPGKKETQIFTRQASYRL